MAGSKFLDNVRNFVNANIMRHYDSPQFIHFSVPLHKRLSHHLCTGMWPNSQAQGGIVVDNYDLSCCPTPVKSKINLHFDKPSSLHNSSLGIQSFITFLLKAGNFYVGIWLK